MNAACTANRSLPSSAPSYSPLRKAAHGRRSRATSLSPSCAPGPDRRQLKRSRSSTPPSTTLPKRHRTTYNAGSQHPAHPADIPAPRPLATTTPDRRLPFLHPFTCVFHEILHEGPLTLVLLVGPPDSEMFDAGDMRVLKLYACRPADTRARHTREAYTREYRAYSSLVARGVSVKPGSSTMSPRVVPYCYGAVKASSLSSLFATTAFPEFSRIEQSPALNLYPAHHGFRGLILEYIPSSVTVASSLSSLTPRMAIRAIEALEQIHDAGVLHLDAYPRNILLVDGDVLWIDFDSAMTTCYWMIDVRQFRRERALVERTLLLDVIPAAWAGKRPKYEMWV
ncbi:hypothetical protein BDD12DRAFT_845846 [Trichophaea hybrida]|nr:hypothetical protein BDD12DRAFT_845846 [Trichophaea hybrida]